MKIKIVLVVIFVLAAIVSGVFGLLARADPEGRGGHIAEYLWGCSGACLTLSASVWIWW